MALYYTRLGLTTTVVTPATYADSWSPGVDSIISEPLTVVSDGLAGPAAWGILRISRRARMTLVFEFPRPPGPSSLMFVLTTLHATGMW